MSNNAGRPDRPEIFKKTNPNALKRVNFQRANSQIPKKETGFKYPNVPPPPPPLAFPLWDLFV